MTMPRCVVATGNPGKLRELERLLDPLGIRACSQQDFGIEAPDEPFPGFVENALVKARHASGLAGLPAIADDSGICVPALGGEPGIYSARFAQRAGQGAGDEANNRWLVERLRSIAPQADDPARTACYVCVLVWVEHPADPLPLIAQGLWYGHVIDSPRGSAGFGYDPHFLLPDLGRTAAELAPEHKNAISHRALAMQSLGAHLLSRNAHARVPAG